MAESSRVGVRELRQNLSVYLRRVFEGETLEVTDRGVAVARLVPLAEREDPVSRLVADGKLVRATRNHRRLGPPLEGGSSISKALDDVRADRI